MSEFNLLDEAWISVMIDKKGGTKEVSVTELFRHADEYIDLAGDSVTQDFAVMRVLLAILQTVFTRYDSEGEPYYYLELDDKMRQIEEIESENDWKYLGKDLKKTWIRLWERRELPQIIYDYLDVWHDRFYLFDDEFPFYQVTASDISQDKISKAKPSSLSAKTMNRLISESGNKTALFSPRIESTKELLTAPEIARWLITFQGYSGLSDKVIFGTEKYKASKGWLFDIGGVFLKGDTLYETLLLNLMLVHPEKNLLKYAQEPCWEFNSEEWLERYFSEDDVYNLAELYTNWSRGIYIDPLVNLDKPFSFSIVKIPEINHQNKYLEAMTLWRFNKNGDNKDKFTPRKHTVNQAMWRSFGLMTLPNKIGDEHRRPGIMSWLDDIQEAIGESDVHIQAVSMRDDGNATSWMPIDEIHDNLRVNDLVVTDIAADGWVVRISDIIEHTNQVIDHTFRSFMKDISEIRGLDSRSQFVDQQVSDLYYLIDQPFREWLSSIELNDSRQEKINEWMEILNLIVIKQAQKRLNQATHRDYVGVTKEVSGKEMQVNIITAFHRFKYFLNKR